MWEELQVVGLPRKRLKAVSHALFALGCAGVQEDHLPGEAPPPRQPWDTGPPPPPTERLLLRAWFEDTGHTAIERELGHLGCELVWHEVVDEDWSTSWQAHFQPLTVGRFVIAPPWDAPEGALIIQPGQGFGTGQHPTTRQILEQLPEVAVAGERCLDIGCGSGILALAAARLGLVCEGIDVEPEAIEDAKANADRNGLEATFSTTPIDAMPSPAPLVLANLHAELVARLAVDLVRLTARDLLVAGVLADREPIVREALAALELVARRQDDEWVALHYRAVPAP